MTVGLFIPKWTSAQSPNKISYQAIVRDASNVLITSTAVSMQISILRDSARGTAVYVETQKPTSNANGLVSLEIGVGKLVSGNFDAIDWANGPYFIKTETDPKGGTSYTISGTNQLLSVPYSLHSKTAESISGDSSNNFYLGQDTLGGIVYYIYIGSDGKQHGLIVNKKDSNGIWQSTYSITTGNRNWDGLYNTGLMTGSPIATYVKALTDGGFTDWYLPSLDELILLFNNRFHVDKGLFDTGSPLLSMTQYYWSSTEDANPFQAWAVYPRNGFFSSTPPKNNNYKVRAIRAF
jgi:hypothetical protein